MKIIVINFKIEEVKINIPIINILNKTSDLLLI